MIPTSFGGELAVAFTIFLVDMLFEGEHRLGGVILEAPVVEHEIKYTRGFEGLDSQADCSRVQNLFVDSLRKQLGIANAHPEAFNVIIGVPCWSAWRNFAQF
jgi:hypothetical protein